MGIVPFKIKL